MEFRDLKRQYELIKTEVDEGIAKVISQANFIQGKQVAELEQQLAAYVGVKHCISCANGTDALQLALMAWHIGQGDVVFVPDFTFFSSGEVVPTVGATPVFVDVRPDTMNIDCDHLETMITKVMDEGKLTPKAIVAVDLFGQTAEFDRIREIAKKYNLYILEDAAQSFGAEYKGAKSCSLGDIGTTSFFPAKPLGCYGDGGAVFTDNDEWAELLRSYRVHGKGSCKYDNVRIGMNSRLDTIQAAVLSAKLPTFANKELAMQDKVVAKYMTDLSDTELSEQVKLPVILEECYSSWAQFTIQLPNRETRDGLQAYMKEQGIPTAVYYQKPMHRQTAFGDYPYADDEYKVTNHLSEVVLSLPFHPYMTEEEIAMVTGAIKTYFQQK